MNRTDVNKEQRALTFTCSIILASQNNNSPLYGFQLFDRGLTH